MHRLKTMSSTAILFFAAVTNAGCGGSAPPPATSAVTTVTNAASGAQAGEDSAGTPFLERHRYRHGGVPMFLEMSLRSLGVSDDQRAAISRIQHDLLTQLEPLHAAQSKVLLLLADGVAAGAVDQARVDAAIAEVDVASAGMAKTAAAAALERLHSVLNAPQRRALVQKIEAHWQIWQEANAEGEGGAGHGGDRFAALALDTSVTTDQVDHIRATLRASSQGTRKMLDPAEVDARLKTFGAAFEGDVFDAKTLNDGQGVNVELTSGAIQPMARFYEAAAPVLAPDQRAKYAENLRDHAEEDESQ